MNSFASSRLVLLAGLSCFTPAVVHAAPDQTVAARDGAHDFDFDFGTWKIHMWRLEHPLSGSKTAFTMDGVTTNRKLWDGRANIAEVEGDGPHGHLEILALRLYDPVEHQWSINFANSKVGTFGVPLVGEFKDGHGVFMDQEPINGRTMLVRFMIWSTGANSAHSEQAFSEDQGKTWETNWVNDYTKISDAEKAQPADGAAQ